MEPASLDQLVARYDAFLVDQFGVLLDGSASYPGAAEALAHVARSGRRVILLSNSGKRSGPNAERLYLLGFAHGSFELVLSSGEAGHRWLDGQGLAAGTRVWLHARDGDESAIEGLSLRQVSRPEDAKLLVLAGSRADVFGMEDYEGWLRPAAAKRVPMLCTNPDMSMLTPAGKKPGAGRIATLYQGLGGKVEWVGKPYPLIYRLARQLLVGIPPDRILCIGDSPAHDIKGGAEAGLCTALVRTGLHADTPDAALAALCQDEAGVLPDHILPRFSL